MSEKRYQVYISTSSYEDMKPESLKLEYALLNLGGMPWQFHEPRQVLNNAIARKQIEESDMVVFLLGQQYGDLSTSGVSYMQTDFTYALNKNKPVIALLDATGPQQIQQVYAQDPELQRKYMQFRQQLRQQARHVVEYQNVMELERHIKTLFIQVIRSEALHQLGWVRPKLAGMVQSEVQRLRQKISKLESTIHQSAGVMAVGALTSSTSSATRPDTLSISYRTQAYQDGNLKDLRLQRDLSLQQLLGLLAPHFRQPLAESQFQTILNQYLEHHALADVQATMPRVHAVARTQIDARSLQQIKLQMKWNNWIVPEGNRDGIARIQWILTPEGQRVVQEAS